MEKINCPICNCLMEFDETFFEQNLINYHCNCLNCLWDVAATVYFGKLNSVRVYHKIDGNVICLIFDYNRQTTHISFSDNYKNIRLDFILKITPQNFKEKIQTITNFG